MKNLYKVNEAKNVKIENHVNNALIDLRNAVSRKENPENEDPDKVIDIVEEMLNFNKQQKRKELKILTPKRSILNYAIYLFIYLFIFNLFSVDK